MSEFQGIIELIDNEEVVIHVLEQSGWESAAIAKAESQFALEVNYEERNMTWGTASSASKYQIGGERGIIGLIGPKRMDYTDVLLPLVDICGARHVRSAWR